MLDDPVTTLQALLARDPEPDSGDAVEDLARSQDFYEDRDAIDRVHAEMLARFDELVARIAAAWGPPDVRAQPVPAFPWRDDNAEPESLIEARYWLGAVAIAVWRRAGRSAFACLEHQDAELPISLLVGVSNMEPGDAGMDGG